MVDGSDRQANGRIGAAQKPTAPNPGLFALVKLMARIEAEAAFSKSCYDPESIKPTEQEEP